MADIPVVVTAAGAQPTPPATLLADLIAGVAATNPGYTATLPGSLIEDFSSTGVGALVICDTARVETINSLTPYGANDFLLLQLGQIYIGPGSAPASPTNTSVFVQFTAVDQSLNPLPGLVIPRGFVVSDGIYQYVVQDGGVTAASGISDPLFCQATITGSWAVPTGSVSQTVTSAPANVTITCSNPLPGTAGAAMETPAQYRARVLQAGRAVATGTAPMLKTLLGNVPGVQQRLISTKQNADGTWTVITGGGDPYLTAQAISDSGLNIATLEGAILAITGVTNANPGVVTTATNHNLTTGAQVTASGIVGMTQLNGLLVTVTVLSEKTFSISQNTAGFSPYISGGVLTPNPINVTPNLFDSPDIYSVPFVNPPAQTVTLTVHYSTTAPNFTSQASVAQLGSTALAAYVNSIPVGRPLNYLVMAQLFSEAIASVLDPSLISSFTVAVSINGIPTPAVGVIFASDPFSYLTATTAGVVVSQV